MIDGSSISDRMALAAAVRLQIWSRGALLSRKFCIMKNEYFFLDDPVIKELCNAGMQDIISAPSRAVRNVLKIFITSELKHLRARRQHQLLVSRRIVSDVLNDIMDDILLICKQAATSGKHLPYFYIRLQLYCCIDMRDSLAQLNRVSYEVCRHLLNILSFFFCSFLLQGTDRLSDQPVGRMGAFTRTFAGE